VSPKCKYENKDYSLVLTVNTMVVLGCPSRTLQSMIPLGGSRSSLASPLHR